MFKLETLPGQLINGSVDRYLVVPRKGGWSLHNHQLAPKTYPTLESLAHSLGAVVPWDRWSRESQALLTALNLRGYL